MEDALGWALATFALTIVAFGIKWVVDRFVGGRDIAALPEAPDRFRYLAEVRRMRGSGASLQECVEHLRGYGLRAGVARGLVTDMERAESADVENPKECAWRDFRFSCPGNWRLQPLLPKLGNDPGITVEGLGCGIFFLVGLDAESILTDVVEEWEKQILDPQRTPLRSWGPLLGEGEVLTGPHSKVRLPVVMSIFRPEPVDAPYALMEMHSVEEAELVTPAFKLIRETFREEGAPPD